MNQIIKLLCLLILTMATLVLTSCQPNGDTSISSSDSSTSDGDQVQSDQHLEGPMSIEGEVIAIMESWPLQLTIKTSDGELHVDLLEETVISIDGESMTPSDLSTAQLIRVEGEAGDGSIAAQAIEVLSR